MAKSDFFPYENPTPNSPGYQYATGMSRVQSGAHNPLKSTPNSVIDSARKDHYRAAWGKDPSSMNLKGAALSTAKAMGKVALGGAAVLASGMTYADEYGWGAAGAYGLASMAPFAGTAILIGEVGVAALSYGHQKYHERRRLNFGSPAQDQFGTLATMRQRSVENLSRGRAALGNEARLHHF